MSPPSAPSSSPSRTSRTRRRPSDPSPGTCSCIPYSVFLHPRASIVYGSGRGAVRLAHLTGGQEVLGSNPSAPTSYANSALRRPRHAGEDATSARYWLPHRPCASSRATGHDEALQPDTLAGRRGQGAPSTSRRQTALASDELERSPIPIRCGRGASCASATRAQKRERGNETRRRTARLPDVRKGREGQATEQHSERNGLSYLLLT